MPRRHLLSLRGERRQRRDKICRFSLDENRRRRFHLNRPIQAGLRPGRWGTSYPGSFLPVFIPVSCLHDKSLWGAALRGFSFCCGFFYEKNNPIRTTVGIFLFLIFYTVLCQKQLKQRKEVYALWRDAQRKCVTPSIVTMRSPGPYVLFLILTIFHDFLDAAVQDLA